MLYEKCIFQICTCNYVFPIIVNLDIDKAPGQNNKILTSSTDIKIGLNKKIDKDEIDHEKYTKSVSPASPLEAQDISEMHCMKIPNKSIKHIETKLSRFRNQKINGVKIKLNGL